MSLIESWRICFPNVELRLSEMPDRDLIAYLVERRIDVALMTKHSVPPYVVAEPLCRERLFLALPYRHRLARREPVGWANLRSETFLVQGWDESQMAREFYATFLGSGVRYQVHATSKQSIMALVGAGFGVTIVSKGQSEVRFPGVAYKAIAEENAWLELDLCWLSENKQAVVGRFIAFMRDEARSRRLV